MRGPCRALRRDARSVCGRLSSVPNEPLAHFISFRTYGTWLHGDERGSTDRRHNKRGEPFLPRDDFRREFAARKQSGESVILGSAARACVDTSIRATCANREWQLLALNVRTNHVHLVVSATVAPERVMDALKAWATRRLRAAGLAAADARIWSRHGSTERIWLQRELDAACEYVTNGQDEKLA